MLIVDHLISVVLVVMGGLVQRASIPPSTYLARVRLRIETCTRKISALAKLLRQEARSISFSLTRHQKYMGAGNASCFKDCLF